DSFSNQIRGHSLMGELRRKDYWRGLFFSRAAIWRLCLSGLTLTLRRKILIKSWILSIRRLIRRARYRTETKSGVTDSAGKARLVTIVDSGSIPRPSWASPTAPAKRVL